MEAKQGRIKVLFVIWSLERGGAERFLVSLLNRMNKERFYPVVCCLNWKGKWAQEVEKAGVKVIALNKRGKIDLVVFWRLWRIIREGGFHIVNTYLWGADVVGRLIAILARTPVIVSTVQNVDVWKRWYHVVIDKLLARKTDMFIAVSEKVREYCTRRFGIPDKKITVIYNAVDVEKFVNNGDSAYLYDELKLKENDFILLCIGRLSKQKGQKYLLESFSRLHRHYPELKILFAGDGEDRKVLQTRAEELGITEKVRFLGQRDDIPQLLHISKGLVLPSLYEGLPVCVAEAMASAKPVIATSGGGTPEIVLDGETGFLVPPRDVDGLTSAIKKIIDFPDNAKSMGEKARRIVAEKFSIEAITRQTEELFISLVKRSQ